MMKILFFTILLIISITSSVCCEEAKIISNVLGRTVRLNELCEDFESSNWGDSYNSGNDYWHDPPTSTPGKRGVELLELIDTPPNGKLGSSQALKISRINDPKQQELLSPAFGIKLKHNLVRANMPVFIVRIFFPPFDQWGQTYGFGFRQETHASNVINIPNNEYSTSIWVKKNQDDVKFYFRAANGTSGDLSSDIIVQPGWWTLAVAFDDQGVGHYYISKGTDAPTNKDKVFDTNNFPAPNNPLMDDVVYSYFAISAIKGQFNIVPQFVIDDYEVWICNTSQ